MLAFLVEKILCPEHFFPHNSDMPRALLCFFCVPEEAPCCAGRVELPGSQSSKVKVGTAECTFQLH